MSWKAEVAEILNLHEEGSVQRARERCISLLERAPDRARGWRVRAAIEHRLGNNKDAMLCLRKAMALRPDVGEFHHALGILQQGAGEYDDALSSFRAAAAADSGNTRFALSEAQALRKLGRGDEATLAFERATSQGGASASTLYKFAQHLRSVGLYERAVFQYRRALQVEPGHALAAFWLSATQKLATGGLGEEVDPAAAPVEYIEGLYNGYADKFDEHLTKALGYQTPSVLAQAIKKVFPNRRWACCVDLGCGTGLSGEAVASSCSRLVGIDLSQGMVEKARSKGIYDSLLVADLSVGLQTLLADQQRSLSPGTETTPGPESDDSEGVATGQAKPPVQLEYDLFLSCDVFVYLGDLGSVLEAVACLSTRNAVFAFSTEALEGGDGYHLQGTGRYAHSRLYLERACKEAGFSVKLVLKSVLRQQGGKPVHGYLTVTERGLQ